jgi:hypothetical protein
MAKNKTKNAGISDELAAEIRARKEEYPGVPLPEEMLERIKAENATAQKTVKKGGFIAAKAAIDEMNIDEMTNELLEITFARKERGYGGNLRTRYEPYNRGSFKQAGHPEMVSYLVQKLLDKSDEIKKGSNERAKQVLGIMELKPEDELGQPSNMCDYFEEVFYSGVIAGHKSQSAALSQVKDAAVEVFGEMSDKDLLAHKSVRDWLKIERKTK